jgi:hypothetical protein
MFFCWGALLDLQALVSQLGHLNTTGGALTPNRETDNTSLKLQPQLSNVGSVYDNAPCRRSHRVDMQAVAT